MVGALVVGEGGRIIAEGWHRRAGEGHAEANALAAAGAAARGQTLFVTLEPCCHRGPAKRRPPCTDAVIAAGVKRVVVAALDPNPEVAGRGVEVLRAANIAVETGVRAAEAEALNVAFAHWITTRMPYVRVKLAQSIDGRIARGAGLRHWVTGAVARARVHRLRADADAVMVGSETVKVDDPQLTARDVPGDPSLQDWLPPAAIAVDSRLSIGPGAAIYAPARPGGAIVLTALGVDHPSALALRERGVEVVSAPGPKGWAGRVDLVAALRQLGARAVKPVTSILVEGGGTLVASLLAAGLVHEVILHVAPVAYGSAGVPSIGALASEAGLSLVGMAPLGPDLELLYRVVPPEPLPEGVG